MHPVHTTHRPPCPSSRLRVSARVTFRGRGTPSVLPLALRACRASASRCRRRLGKDGRGASGARGGAVRRRAVGRRTCTGAGHARAGACARAAAPSTAQQCAYLCCHGPSCVKWLVWRAPARCASARPRICRSNVTERNSAPNQRSLVPSGGSRADSRHGLVASFRMRSCSTRRSCRSPPNRRPLLARDQTSPPRRRRYTRSPQRAPGCMLAWTTACRRRQRNGTTGRSR